MFGYIHVRCDTRFSLLSVFWVFVETLLVVHSLLTCQHRSTAHFQPQSGSGAGCTESCWKQGFIELVLIWAVTIPMSEDEEVLDDYLMRDSFSPTEYMLELIAQNMQKDWSFLSDYSKNSTLL